MSTWLLSVDPVPTDRVVDMTSVSINPDVSVLYHAGRVSHYELLKHVVNVLICDNWQRWIPSRTKLSRIIPTQLGTVSVETIVLTVHVVALGHLVCLCEAGTYVPCKCSNNYKLIHGVTLKIMWVGVVQDHWKWRRPIDHITTYFWPAIVCIALFCTIFELFDVE